MNTRHYICKFLISAIASLLLIGCSATRHVPQGEYLLDKVRVDVDDPGGDVSSADLINYLRQQPNHKVLGFWKLQLGTYNLSGSDTTKWYNRWVRRMGQAPVIYRQDLTDASVRQLRLAMINKGYLGADVKVDTILRPDKRKIEVDYKVSAGVPHRISSVAYDIPDTAVARILLSDSLVLSVRPGDKFDRDNLDAERQMMTRLLKNHGYYDFNKEYITFVADTAENSKEVGLTLIVRPPRLKADSVGHAIQAHKKYVIRNVTFVTAGGVVLTPADIRKVDLDTVNYGDITILYGKDHYLKPSVLDEKCFLTPGQLYTTRDVDRTYEALSRLGILRSVNIDLVPSGPGMLDAYVILARNKKQSITFDVEGTNSEGDLGFGIGATYQHRNLGHGSEQLTAKLRGAYESISGNLDGLINNRYTEIASEVGLTFPKFEFPFLSKRFKMKVRASTEFAVSFNYQERPEYTRLIFGAGWKYKWQQRLRDFQYRHTFDLIDVNVVRLPRSTIDFLDEIAPDNPLLRYSYEDHFIMRLGYSFYHTNKRTPLPWQRSPQRDIYTIRVNAETAGNLLYAISNIFAKRPEEKDNSFKIFGIHYSQYVKADSDVAYTHIFSDRQSVACRIGLGIGYPYGNSTILPFEKRFYGGGANGVRGWAVRTLGPGCFRGTESATDFMNQCGDIRFILSGEYRLKLFWIVELGAFIDIGNIWTIRDYANQPGGLFRFKDFGKQFAAAYGLGIRLDFNYFLLRFDLGMKAHNPAQGEEPWPLIHPRWGRDRAFHFSIGYPF